MPEILNFLLAGAALAGAIGAAGVPIALHQLSETRNMRRAMRRALESLA